MRTNIVIEDALMQKALSLCEIKTKRELIDTALREFIRNREMKDLRDLRGKITFQEDYDYKKLRELERP